MGSFRSLYCLLVFFFSYTLRFMLFCDLVSGSVAVVSILSKGKVAVFTPVS